MEILRAKTSGLLQVKELTEKQAANTKLNKHEMENKALRLDSKPQRLVLELTNACNLRCIMCGRDDFDLTFFNTDFLKSLAPLLHIVEEVTLFGWGEPTMHPAFVNILEFLNNYPVKKYFVTNGMRLDKIRDAIFKYRVDIMAISVDGATKETNDSIRVNSNLDFIVEQLKEIVRIKKKKMVTYPYMNFVMTLFNSNIGELPALIHLASEIGLDEVKCVYLTVFNESLLHESLYDEQNKVKRIFDEAYKVAQYHNIKLKLPYLQGEDVADDDEHKPCFTTWRDFFVGSDGYVRPCQSNSVKFFEYSTEVEFEDMWNSKDYQDFRRNVNCSSMNGECKRCYQSSHANWNKRSSFLQIGEVFAPKWKKG